MAVDILNPGNPRVYRASENLEGFEWQCASLDPTDITSVVFMMARLRNWSQVNGPAVSPYNGGAITATPSGSGVNFFYSWPNPPAARPIGQYIGYWKATYSDSHTLAGGGILFEIVPD